MPKIGAALITVLITFDYFRRPNSDPSKILETPDKLDNIASLTHIPFLSAPSLCFFRAPENADTAHRTYSLNQPTLLYVQSTRIDARSIRDRLTGFIGT